jgi:hypothetical protein
MISKPLVQGSCRGQLATLERVSFYDITFSGTTLPHAIELELTHDPDASQGGNGKAYAVDPISGIKNVSWADDGNILKVILMPTEDGMITDFRDFRFYVAGGVTNRANLSGVQAFDINGNAVAGVSVNIDYHPITITTTQ